MGCRDSWLRDAAGPRIYRVNQRWLETPDGYLWAPQVQPVRNRPNALVRELPQTSLGAGMWAEVSVPYVDLTLANPPARAPWLQNRLNSNLPPRFFYSQIAWVDAIKTDARGQVWYRVNERYGYGDIFWAAAEAFRPITPDEIRSYQNRIPFGRRMVRFMDQIFFEPDGSWSY